MKTIRLHAPNDLRLHDEPRPEAGQGKVLVRVKVVGTCGSDLHWSNEAGIGDARLLKPIVLGQEFTGEVAEGPRRDERVAVDPAIPCHFYEYCLHGNTNLCEHIHFAGHGLEDGALHEIHLSACNRIGQKRKGGSTLSGHANVSARAGCRGFQVGRAA